MGIIILATLFGILEGVVVMFGIIIALLLGLKYTGLIFLDLLVMVESAGHKKKGVRHG